MTAKNNSPLVRFFDVCPWRICPLPGRLFSIMPAPRRTKRKKAPLAERTSDKPRPRAVRNALLYHEERFPDGSTRAVRCISRQERERAQALSDFYGVQGQLSVDENVRSMAAILGDLLEKMELCASEFAPEALAGAWLKAVGPFLASQAELLSISGQRARIRTSHPAVRYELSRIKPQIISALNEALGKGCVKSVQVIHG